jgi:signal transduction histidine kinase
VGIGASAGGIDALERFVGALPPATGMAFVVVQHLASDHESTLVSLLSKHTDAAVREATDGTAPAPNQVYVVPPGRRLELHGGRLRASETGTAHEGSTVDRFFRSLAADQGTGAVGIVLSGRGTDGARGLRRIKEGGGLALAQSPEEAEHDGMPRSAISTGLVDLVAPAAELATTLPEYWDRAGTGQPPKQTEEFHRLAVKAAGVGTWSVDLETGEAAISSRMAALMGYAPDEHGAVLPAPEQRHWQRTVSREAWLDSIHPDDRPAMEQRLVTARDTGGPFEMEFRVQRTDGIRWLYSKGEVITAGPNGGRRLRGASVDVTERRELEETLVGASEKVRRDIGRQLHDVLGSDLAALAMQADNLAHKLRPGASSGDTSSADVSLADAVEGLEQIAAGVRAAAEQSRTFSHALIPTPLQEEHLAAALAHLCREQAELGRPAPTFEGDREEPLPDDEETAMHLYRVAQEAITNAQRHAGAEHIWVRLVRAAGRLVLTVRDDGGGLPEDAAPREGIGLRTMVHRADLIGATLQVGPAADGGTVVRCALPLGKPS